MCSFSIRYRSFWTGDLPTLHECSPAVLVGRALYPQLRCWLAENKVIFDVGLAVATALLFWVTYGMVRAAIVAARQSSVQHRNEFRPILFLDPNSVNYLPVELGGIYLSNFRIEGAVRNIGRGPALSCKATLTEADGTASPIPLPDIAAGRATKLKMTKQSQYPFGNASIVGWQLRLTCIDVFGAECATIIRPTDLAAYDVERLPTFTTDVPRRTFSQWTVAFFDLHGPGPIFVFAALTAALMFVLYYDFFIGFH